MSAPYSIVTYSLENLRDILGQASEVDGTALNGKLHLVYFKEYFAALKANTIVIEEGYVDHDYLEDYAGYYVRCFTKYRRKCRRLHFFSVPFTCDDFEALLVGHSSLIDENILNHAYLGFVVVKPLPQTIIGRTCLKTYGDDGGRRHYSSTQLVTSHLFGIPLQINTLPFQEQDSVVAACATSALWTVFHGCGYLLQHTIPSPVEITKKATSLLPLETRSLPSRGLTPAQMAYAIRGVGLEPFLVDAVNLPALKGAVYAYLSGGISLILGIDLVDTSFSTGSSIKGRYIGRHAVAITGFSLGKRDSKSTNFVNPWTEGILKAARIDKIYVHDDQVGPFARMAFDGVNISFQSNGKSYSGESLSTSWRGNDGIIGSIRAMTNILLIPLYHKIRIPFGVIYDYVHCLDTFIETLRQEQKLELNSRIEWDIYLTTVNRYKNEVLKSGIYHEERHKVLTSGLPKFIWRATALAGDNALFDLLFDATDIEQASLLTAIIPFDRGMVDTLIHSFNTMSEKTRNHPGLTIVNWIARKHSSS